MSKRPSATYRLQLHGGFTFDDAAAVAEYLRALGVSHVYCSPYLQAAPGSMHGYDVADHSRVNEELGGTAGHERFCAKLGEAQLGQVLDIVPNHMAISRENRYWWDVLENGPSSRYASFFDIEWHTPEERLRDKVLLPILEDQYGRVLQKGEIQVTRKGGSFLVECAGQALPVSPLTIPLILERAGKEKDSDRMHFLNASFGRLPSPDFADREEVLERHRDQEVLHDLLQQMCGEEAESCVAIDHAIAALNADIDALDEFLNRQNYRLAYWRTAGQQLGYRRFFDVNTLIGLRMERRHVFEETHALVLDWLRRGVLDGVRVDHPDGLRDPLEYFRRLRERAPEAWILGEKILQPGEMLRESWPIEGTSGYEFIYAASSVLVDGRGMEWLRSIYAEFTGEPVDFPAIAHDKKLGVAQEALGSDVNRLAELFVQICESHRDQRDFTRAEMRRAIREMAACFGVYRTYVMPERGEITGEDRQWITQGAECAKGFRQDIDGGLFDFMRDVLMLEVRGPVETEFVLRFQQFTSPVMAKGVEDTAFYCFHRLTSMCEVGSDPGRDGMSVEEFHGHCARMQATHPETMTTLSTHDTKRSDDVRARLAVLSEMADEWGEMVRQWSARNVRYKTGEWPDRNAEWLYYQTVVGAWPISAERLQEYMRKAGREAKQRTSWTQVNQEYEDAVSRFIDATMGDAGFVRGVEEFVARIRAAGWRNSLAQTLLKHVAPGVPDLYQGGELWDLTLVDPDNRRPVDYELRRRLLREMHGLTVEQMVERMEEGLPKMWLIHRALTLRRERPEWFGAEAGYVGLRVRGAKSGHVIAAMRGGRVAAVAPRLTLGLEDWGDTTVELAQGRWRERLTGDVVEGGMVNVGELLRRFTVALLVKEDGRDA